MDKNNNNSGKTSPDSGGSSSNKVNSNNNKKPGRSSPPVSHQVKPAPSSSKQNGGKKKSKKGGASGKAAAAAGITKLMDIQVNAEKQPIPSLLSMSVPSDRKYLNSESEVMVKKQHQQDLTATRLDEELKKNHVFKSKKANKYRCNLCNYYCNSLDVALKHTLGDIHKNNIQVISLHSISSDFF